MKGRIVIFTTCFCAFLTLVSCVQNDYTKLSTSLVWHPNLSVPLEKSFFSGESIQTSIIPDQGPLPEKITVSDTISFDFAELFIYTEKINYLKFRVFMENGFPAKLKTQTYFMNYTRVLDSLYKAGPREISMAEIAQDGSLVSPFIFSEDVQMEDAEVDELENVKMIWTKVEFYDYDPGFLQNENLSDYYLKVELGLQAQIEKEKK